jgi:hypothetical protein
VKIITLVFIAVAIASSVRAQDPVEAFIALKLEHAPRHYLYDADARARFVAELRAAGAAHDIDPALLAVISYLESSWMPGAVGGIGERGVMQVHGAAADGCDLSTRRGQLDCGAAWLRRSYDACGSWPGALTMYATGACKPRTDRVKRLVKYRLKMWEGVSNAVD